MMKRWSLCIGCMAQWRQKSRSCVQRTIKRAELTAFLCHFNRVIGPVRVHVDNKRIIDGLYEMEKVKGIKPTAGDADLWIAIWEELHGLAERCILVEVEHVKAHRTKKEKKHMSQFEMVCHRR